MAVLKLKAYEAAVANVLTTELNSLANNTNTAASGLIQNDTGLHLYATFELILAAQGTNRTAGAFIGLYVIEALDGTTLDTVNHDTAQLLCAFPLDSGALAARQVSRRFNQLAPGEYAFFARNATGQTLAASGSSIRVRFHNLEST